MSTLGNRIKYVRDNILKINQANFAEKLGFSRIATISDYEKNKRNPDVTTLRKIACLGTVSLDWLLVGDNVEDAPPPNTKLSHYAKRSSSTKAAPPVFADKYVSIEVYGIGGIGTSKSFPSSEAIDSITIRRSDYSSDTVAVKIVGDSMSPALLDGTIVGIDTSDKQVVSGRLYAVWFKYEGITIKRVFISTDRVILKPDNPTFHEVNIPKIDVSSSLVIGRVKWAFQRY